MQGRLSAPLDGRIQSFPVTNWRDEYQAAVVCGFEIMEWTLDHVGLWQNPLMTRSGRKEIRQLCALHSLEIPSVTGDCFMQAPFWKAPPEGRQVLREEFLNITEACSDLGVKMLMIPLVDNGSLQTEAQELLLLEFLTRYAQRFAELGIKILVESDFPPAQLEKFVSNLSNSTFGINYDIGNSAALGFDPVSEFAHYSDRIDNVHVKDRERGGTTVALGEGSADLSCTFKLLFDHGYSGNYILQTARASDGDHAGALCRFRDLTLRWLECYES